MNENEEDWGWGRMRMNEEELGWMRINEDEWERIRKNEEEWGWMRMKEFGLNRMNGDGIDELMMEGWVGFACNLSSAAKL